MFKMLIYLELLEAIEICQTELFLKISRDSIFRYLLVYKDISMYTNF